MSKFNPSDFTILIVDDLPKNIQVLGSVLKNQNYKVEFAINGTKALEWVKKKIFDLVLLDIMMPKMSGYEVCEEIRKDHRYEDIPIVFLTAKTETDNIVKGFQVGGQDYITKPFDSDELLARVRTYLELKQSKQTLKVINEELENKVIQRTQELNISNDRLTDANRELEALNKELIDLDIEKSRFLGIICHEIRTPLNGIKGFLELVKAKIGDKDLIKYLNYIDKSSNRLERFATQALLITELRIKKRAIIRNNLQTKAILQDVCQDFYKKDNMQKEVSITYDKINENLSIYADKFLLKHCLNSILNNAIEYSDPGAEIQIIAERSANSVRIDIIDQGPGFSKLAIQNMFKMFAPGKEHIDKNMGLDLVVVHLIMKSHNGEILVKNNFTKGATVSLIFPEGQSH